MKGSSGGESAYLTGHFLVAMPGVNSPLFNRSLIYLCAHGPDGAMGLIINKIQMDGDHRPMTFGTLMPQLDIATTPDSARLPVLAGGPVEPGRGFVLHTDDYDHEGTMTIEPGIALTATVDILKAIADGAGPKQLIFTLGYAGWSPGQLDQELQSNGWLSCPADSQILFDTDIAHKWDKALDKMGIAARFLSHEAGHA